MIVDLRRSVLLLFVFTLAVVTLLTSGPLHDADMASAQAIWSNSNAAPPRPPVIDEFVPELTNVPSFDEDDAITKSSSAKLIEVREFRSPEDKWPSYSKEELPVRSGETWLGLYQTAGELFFSDTKLTRSDRKGYVGPGDATYDWLKYETHGDLIFLIKNAPALRQGKVKTLFRTAASPDTEDASLVVGNKRTFQMGDNNYLLRVTSGLQSDGGRVNVLVLESGAKSQIVMFNYYYKDHNTLYNEIGNLIWAGDMDGDGKLDLYLHEYGYEKGGFGSRLYLSSPAKDGRLVEYVAGFGSAGC
jgi:hypothetical protein